MHVRKNLAWLGAGLERLEDRWLLAADGLASPAAALAPFTPSGSGFKSGYVDLPVPAAHVSYEPVTSGGYTPQQLRHAYGLDQTLDWLAEMN